MCEELWKLDSWSTGRDLLQMNTYVLVICMTVLPDQSVLTIRRTMQINSRPTEIVIFLEVKWPFAWVMSLISTNQNYV